MAMAITTIIAITPPTMNVTRSAFVARPVGGAAVGAGVTASLAVKYVCADDG